MKKVLIVEDDQMVAHINTKYIQRNVFYSVVKVVNDGKEALDFLKDNKVDLIILDVYMPRINGLTLVKRLREINCLTDIIMVTAANENETIDEFFKLGVIDYLVKPFSYERFQMAIKRFEQKVDTFSKKYISQNDIDKFLKVSNYKLPKGLQIETLNYLIEVLSKNEGYYMDIEEIAKNSNLSKGSLRKYLEFLEDNGKVVKEIDYGAIGRPKHKFHIKIDQE
ncbi:response regulator [Mycoplasmatota bacterium zrk1]